MRFLILYILILSVNVNAQSISATSSQITEHTFAEWIGNVQANLNTGITFNEWAQINGLNFTKSFPDCVPIRDFPIAYRKTIECRSHASLSSNFIKLAIIIPTEDIQQLPLHRSPFLVTVESKGFNMLEGQCFEGLADKHGGNLTFKTKSLKNADPNGLYMPFYGLLINNSINFVKIDAFPLISVDLIQGKTLQSFSDWSPQKSSPGLLVCDALD
jgi:hypothetical protein